MHSINCGVFVFCAACEFRHGNRHRPRRHPLTIRILTVCKCDDAPTNDDHWLHSIHTYSNDMPRLFGETAANVRFADSLYTTGAFSTSHAKGLREQEQ